MTPAEYLPLQDGEGRKQLAGLSPVAPSCRSPWGKRAVWGGRRDKRLSRGGCWAGEPVPANKPKPMEEKGG